jgi:YjbE family integral membrane protein
VFVLDYIGAQSSLTGGATKLKFQEPIVDLGTYGYVAFTWEFALGILSVILIDIVLAGDNAVVIAMAAQTVPLEKRTKTIIFGAGFAVLLRVALAFFASQLLRFSFVKLIGGLLILWIAVKLLTEDTAAHESRHEAKSMWQAIWIIVVADASMSLDNILALAGASQGNLFLLIFGLALSIPLVIFASTILAQLMDRYPIIIYIGAAILGKVGAELIFTDAVVQRWVHVTKTGIYGLEALFAVGVVLLGWYLSRKKIKMREHAMSSIEQAPEEIQALPEDKIT